MLIHNELDQKSSSLKSRVAIHRCYKFKEEKMYYTFELNDLINTQFDRILRSA